MKEDKTENKPNISNEKPKNNLWEIFKFIASLLFTILIIYKLAMSDLSFDFNKFDFNALLALLLSLFAIGLSVTFYFKATDTSNLFYDNTYKFTKDISTILGRIEAGFGEKLQNLDKGYSGLLNKIDKENTSSKDIEETKTDKKEVEQSLQNEIKERNKIIQNLLEKTQLEQKEKEEFQKALYDKEKSMIKLERESRLLQNKLERQKNLVIIEDIPDKLLNFLKRHILRLNINIEDFNRDKAQDFINQFVPDNENTRLIDKLYIDLVENRLIREDGALTNRGYSVIKNLIRENA
jgi:uncharacterized integral membrane protein